MTVEVRDAEVGDLEAIAEIQNALLASTANDWTDEPHTTTERRDWLRRQRERGFPVLVATDDGRVVGWSSYGDFRDSIKWPGYRYTVELTIHVRRQWWGGDTATALLTALIERARRAGCHVLVAAIDAENGRSLRFHRRLGFIEVGRMPQIGWKLGTWRDLVLLQLLLDDRAEPAGPGRG